MEDLKAKVVLVGGKNNNNNEKHKLDSVKKELFEKFKNITGIFKKSIVFSNKNIAFLFYVYNSMTTR